MVEDSINHFTPFDALYMQVEDDLAKACSGNVNLILVRGISGSGKSTFASMIGAGLCFPVFTSDDYFMKNGTYVFDGSKLGMAHQWNQNRTEMLLANKLSAIVANTLTQRWEMDPYIAMAKKHGAKLHVFTTVYPGKNVHGVPESALGRMRARWEPFEGEVILKPDGVQTFV